MSDSIIPGGVPDIVNLLEGKNCCFCGNRIAKRKQMWKFPDGNYMCIPCKTNFDREKVKSAPYSAKTAEISHFGDN